MKGRQVMSTGALVIRWGAGIPGRETKGLEVFGAAVERFEQHAKAGRIHSHKEYFTLTGKSGGFMLVEGEVDALQTILVEQETLALNNKAEAIVSDFEIQLFAGACRKSATCSRGVRRREPTCASSTTQRRCDQPSRRRTTLIVALCRRVVVRRLNV
jgi:hypothetical protein